MNHFALMILCLFAAAPVHASRVNPLNNGFKIKVGNTVLNQANASFDSITGAVSFKDGAAVYTFTEADASPLIDALSITRTCVTPSVTGCPSIVVSIFNTRVLNGLFQASVEAGVSVQDSARAGTSELVFISTMAGLGVQSALVGYSAGVVVAEPEASSCEVESLLMWLQRRRLGTKMSFVSEARLSGLSYLTSQV